MTKKLIKLFALILCFCGSMTTKAQNFDPFKGVFVKETPKVIIEANLDLRNKTIQGEAEGAELCYGTITITNERGIEGYDVVGCDSLESGEPNIWVVPWMFPDMDSIRVGLDYDTKNKTITLTDWDGGVYFDNVTLKKK